MLEKVQIVIFKKINEKLCVLLLQTNEARGKFWQNITGGIEPEDHNNLYAAQREIKEEIGTLLPLNQIESLNQSFEYFDQRRDQDYKEHLFYVFLESELKISLSPEHMNYKWVDVNDISSSSYKFESSFKAYELSLSDIERKLTNA